MGKRTNHIPSALKHGIYCSGIGLLPTEDPAEFQKFKQEIFDEYAPAGRSQKCIVENIACLMWRQQNLSTYSLANRARNRRSSINAQVDPPCSFSYLPPLLPYIEPDAPPPEPPEELAARRKAADKQVRTELGAAIELVEIGDVATIEHLEKELAIRGRLSGMIAHEIKSFLYVRGIASLSSSADHTS
jgi:hypothetical protein